MGMAAIIAGGISVLCWLATWHHYREAERTGGLEALGVLLYGGAATVTIGLAALFGIIWVLS